MTLLVDCYVSGEWLPRDCP